MVHPHEIPEQIVADLFFCVRFAGANGIHHSYKHNFSISGRVLINGRNFRLRIFAFCGAQKTKKNVNGMRREQNVCLNNGRKKNYLCFMWLLYIRVVEVLKLIQRYYL